MNMCAVIFSEMELSCPAVLARPKPRFKTASPHRRYTFAMDWQAFWLTMRLAAAVTGLLVVIGLPLAYWIAFSKWRWKFLLEAVVALPIVLPPTVLGFYV